MNTNSRERVRQAWCNGMLMPIPGRRSLERQIELEIRNEDQTTLIHTFALGHMLVAYPLVVGVGCMLYMAMEAAGW